MHRLGWVFLVAAGGCMASPRDVVEIRNGEDWADLQGRPIMAHDGGISRFEEGFTWYGSSYEGNPTGRYGPEAASMNRGFNVYHSSDLRAWTCKGVALAVPASGWGSIGTSHRPPISPPTLATHSNWAHSRYTH